MADYAVEMGYQRIMRNLICIYMPYIFDQFKKRLLFVLIQAGSQVHNTFLITHTKEYSDFRLVPGIIAYAVEARLCQCKGQTNDVHGHVIFNDNH